MPPVIDPLLSWYPVYALAPALELVICANKALREIGVKEVKLEISYLLGARSDRKFETGSVNYIKEVLAPIINMQNFSSVTVLDPHSDVTEACINNFIKQTQYSHGFIAFVLRDYFVGRSTDYSKMRLISPDAGALKKIYSVAKDCGVLNVITASKVRDLSTGKILHTEVPLANIDSRPTVFVIVDDICDGGRTFIEVAKAIRTRRPMPEYQDKIFLVVSHGIFSNGLYDLSKWVDGIYSTNSRTDIKADEFSEYTVPSTFLTQFNVY
jgi:ribose-phosphate pyrophosphokinase